MSTTLPTPWRKPSSLAGSHGPELRLCGDNHVEIRHSRDCFTEDGTEMAWAAFSRQEFADLVAAIKAGEYDDLAGIDREDARRPVVEVAPGVFAEVTAADPTGEKCANPHLSANSLAEQSRIDAHVSAERERMRRDPAVTIAREYLASDEMHELVRAHPPCSRDDAMTAVGALIATVRMLLKLIGEPE